MLEGVVKWVTKAPEKKSSATNLLRIFDKTSWGLTFFSMLVVSLSLVVAYRVGTYYGMKPNDVCSTIFVPLAMLNAEGFPRETTVQSRNFFSRGFSQNCILLNWSVFGMVLVFCFLCNLRAMILKPQMEAPIDTTKDLILSGTTPIVIAGFWQDYLLTSVNLWERKAGASDFIQQNSGDTEHHLKSKVQKDGTHAAISQPEEIAYAVKHDPWYKNKQKPVFHFSKESLRPYYIGWVTGKLSPWKKIVDQHIGIILQAGY